MSREILGNQSKDKMLLNLRNCGVRLCGKPGIHRNFVEKVPLKLGMKDR
jgi:hypothetical protein